MKFSKLLSFGAFVFIMGLSVRTNGVLPTFIFVLSLAVHEVFHFICASFLGIKLDMPTVSALGLKFDLKDVKVSGKKGAMLFLSGCFGNLLLAAAALMISRRSNMPYGELFVFYNFSLMAINLIAAYPMDAARALQCILEEHVSELRAVEIMCFVSNLLGCVIFCCGIYLFLFKTDNLIPLILGCLIFRSSAKEAEDAKNAFVKVRVNRYKNLYRNAR